MDQKLFFTSNPASTLDEALAAACHGKLFLLTDSNTLIHCLPLLKSSRHFSEASVITISPGDENKNLDTLSHIWSELSTRGATRNAVMVNIGGGMVTDIGGFAAATFKRGIRFINLPTTLLGAVDAAVGGKTGINFSGLKNEIGAFAPATEVIISANFYSTLPHNELISGYGEVLKHALIDSQQALDHALSCDLSRPDPLKLAPIVEKSVMVKEKIVTEDPFEKGVRRALNLGHTAAHAFESLAMTKGRPVPHGIAVAHGLVTDMVLSHMQCSFSSATLHSVASFIKLHYPTPEFSCKDYPALIDLMRHDKKNTDSTAINFTLLECPGKVRLDCIASPDDIMAALDITRDLLGAP